MPTAQMSYLLTLALDDGRLASHDVPLGRLVAVSLALHVGLLLVAQGLHVAQIGEQPLMAQEVILVSLPLADRSVSTSTRAATKPKPPARAPKPQPVAAPPAPPVSTAKVSPPAPAAAQVTEPKPVPAVAPQEAADKARVRSRTLVQEALSKIKLPSSAVPRGATHPAEAKPDPLLQLPKPTPVPGLALRPEAPDQQSPSVAVVEEALRKIELPPETPEFKGLAPAPSMTPTPAFAARQQPEKEAQVPRANQDLRPTRQLERDVHSLVENLAVPEAPSRLPELPRTPSPAAEKPQPRPSLTQDVRRRLEEIDRLLVAKADPREVPPERANTQKDLQEPLNPKEASSSTSSTQQPRMLIQASQARSGSSKYLARVQHNISKHWIAPPVDLASRSLVVVIQFRLHRSGMVSHVLVEQPSGNDYYDLSAERAVLSANPLPSFPHSLRAPYLDTHFTFAVGEQVG